MNRNKIYIWACDYSNVTGEGNLGRLFVNIVLKKKYKIVINKFKFNKTGIKNIFHYKYIIPFVGIMNCWKFYLLRKKVCYLNYLPLWNFFIFLLLPPKTILGPITGGSSFKDEKTINYFIRKNIFPLFYFISMLILSFRKFDLIFSTNLLKKYLNRNIKKKSKFNFVLNALNIKKKFLTKNLQFIIYYKKHPNKINLYPFELIKSLINSNLKVLVIGDKLQIPGVINLGYLNRKNLKTLLKKSKYAILSGENLLSFFAIDCLNHNVKLLTTQNTNQFNNQIKKELIYINLKKINRLKINYKGIYY